MFIKKIILPVALLCSLVGFNTFGAIYKDTPKPIHVRINVITNSSCNGAIVWVHPPGNSGAGVTFVREPGSCTFTGDLNVSGDDASFIVNVCMSGPQEKGQTSITVKETADVSEYSVPTAGGLCEFE